ncbi:MAG: ABC transporter substrate-binding protein [Symbiobacteriia bacterium]
MSVAYKDDLATLDPAIGYDWTNWPAEKMVFDALLDYDATTHLEPRLAVAMPQVSADAKVYTFTLRKGVKFHNGRELTADDVAYSITRVLDPVTKSPGAGFFTGIDGAQDFIDGKAKTVSGIKVKDPYTIEFTLSQPDVTFLNKMALDFAFVVPKEEVEKWGDAFGHHPVGTGPFVFKEWVSGQHLTFERNPNYFIPGVPKLDKVTIEVGVTPEVALLRVEKGDLDLMGDPIPAADYARIKNDPAWKNRLTTQPQVSTMYLAINTQMKPFTDVRVRQALNMAIDKDRIVKLMGGRGTVANQILPPLMPGYDKSYQGYAYDPDKAKALLAQAGYPDGFSTEMEVIAVDPQPKLAESMQQDLAKIGVKVTLRTLASSTVINDAGTKGKVPLVWSGGLAWIQDYPDPDDFYGPILGSSSAVQGGWNWSWYANPQLDAMADQARGMVDPTARMAVIQTLFRKLMDDAVWVPVYNGEYDIAHSEKLQGKPTDFAHPEHTIFYENLSKAN